MLTYGAFTWSVQQLIDLIQIEDNDRLFSYLPHPYDSEEYEEPDDFDDE